jgi:HD-GYP domain-containing protein (c-di-GMP phosphodiesterase class II)
MTHQADQTGSFWASETIVHPEDLEVGMFVVRLDIPWLDTPFPLEGVLVESERTRAWFEDHCEWVVVDPGRSLQRSAPDASEPAAETADAGDRPPGDGAHPINALRGRRLDEDNVGVSLRSYNLLDTQARRLIRAIDRDATMEVKTAERIVSELSAYLQQNLAAMVWLTRIKDRDAYTAQHSINSAILAMGLAHALEWPPDEVERAGLAALLHDVGNIEIDSDILNKPGLLTRTEYEHVQTHTLRGHELLTRLDDIDPIVARAALEHHERCDGRGYPYGKRAGEIHPVSRLVTVVDVYDAVTSERSHRPARSHHDALGVLWRGRSHKYDRDMVDTFIHFLGWLSPGTMVRLSSGELALVEEPNVAHAFEPVVRKLHRTTGGYRAGERLDLSEMRDDEGLPLIHIDEVLPDGLPGVSVKSLLVSALER